MKSLFFLLILVSCAHEQRIERPYWVEAVRSGEEGMKVIQGNKTFYRRIAGSADVSKQTACNLVIMKAEEDLRKEFPNTKVPYAVEVLYYDVEHKDCAVTISTSRLAPERTVASTPETTAEDEAGNLIVLRSETAAKFALTGITKVEFEKFSKDTVTMITEKNMCSDVFKTDSYSIHGLTHVCWKGDIVAGYCTQKDKQCWTRIP